MGNAVIDNILAYGEKQRWQTVPSLVASRYKEAKQVSQRLGKAISGLPLTDAAYGQVYWHPGKKTAWAILGAEEPESTLHRWHNRLQAVPGVVNVDVTRERGPYNSPDWVLVKKAAGMAWMSAPYRLAGKLTGGPSPLSNAIVSALIGGGLGYGGGWAAEQLMPSQYAKRGRLRKNLAMLGAGLGGALHIPQMLANAKINREATGQSHWLRSLLGGDALQQMAPHELDYRNSMYDAPAAALESAGYKPTEAVTTALNKYASSGVFGSDGAALRPVAVDAFNRAIWNDVHNGGQAAAANPYGTRSPYSDNSDGFTPPAHAAAASGLVTGVQQMYGGRPLLSPRHFISGLANAGLDAATARVAGGVLGALGGLTPEAQQKLQTAGIWSGLIRGVTGSVLGMD